MYAALWRVLPGSRQVKALICALLAAVVLYALFMWAFPFAYDLMQGSTTVEVPDGASG